MIRKNQKTKDVLCVISGHRWDNDYGYITCIDCKIRGRLVTPVMEDERGFNIYEFEPMPVEGADER